MAEQSEREEVFSMVEREDGEIFVRLKVDGKLQEAKLSEEWNTQHEQARFYEWFLETAQEADRA